MKLTGFDKAEQNRFNTLKDLSKGSKGTGGTKDSQKGNGPKGTGGTKDSQKGNGPKGTAGTKGSSKGGGIAKGLDELGRPRKRSGGKVQKRSQGIKKYKAAFQGKVR